MPKQHRRPSSNAESQRRSRQLADHRAIQRYKREILTDTTWADEDKALEAAAIAGSPLKNAESKAAYAHAFALAEKRIRAWQAVSASRDDDKVLQNWVKLSQQAQRSLGLDTQKVDEDDNDED